MGDVHFKCPSCSQPLVAEEKGAGLAIECPHCSRQLQIPFPTRDQTEAKASRKLSKWINRASELERQAYAAETQLAEVRRESEMRQVALAETLQQLRSSHQDLEILQGQLAEVRTDKEALTGKLEATSSELAALKKSAEEIERERNKLADDLKQDHELTHFLAVKAERTRFENDLREVQVVLAETREKL